MKVIANYKRKATNEEGKTELTFELATRQLEEFEQVPYSLEIKKVKDIRSLQQNKYFWLLLTEIAKELNYDNDIYLIYCDIIENTSEAFTFVETTEEAVEILKKSFRAVRMIKETEHLSPRNKPMNIYKCFYGSSKMNKKEMSLLIDGALDIASKTNIDIGYWKKLLK